MKKFEYIGGFLCVYGALLYLMFTVVIPLQWGIPLSWWGSYEVYKEVEWAFIEVFGITFPGWIVVGTPLFMVVLGAVMAIYTSRRMKRSLSSN